ncbi:hypothetical protein WIV_gp159 [Wiseana iridescent virus]|uniref:Uncharacterized protein n=1 Tax=Wiseana iridescent virus TaxID=68347 RepID=G0T5I5_IRV9|nr:hypothetical protein WIV_gp159 [Wiseana iridescent virus]ADO00503.1 hypothetical protein [Wiseana iridescent virus]
MALINNFLKSLAMPVGDLAKWLEEEHQIPVVETISKWNELTGMQISIDEEGSADCEEVEDQTININNKKVGKPTLATGKLNPILCQHVFVAGGRKGQQCGTKPKGGKADRCSAHKIKVKKSDSDSDASKPKKQVKKQVKKAPKKQVKTDSENEAKSSDEESEVETVKPKQQKKIPKSDSENEDSDKDHSLSGSDSEIEDEKPTPKKPAPKKKIQKKVPPSDVESGSESD